jgi:catechol 2,3-dioxygenase-like lactoylglutathione lyase family enzyme
MDFIKIKETCFYVEDLEEAKRFYTEVLELPLISYVPGKHVFFRAGSSVLLCFNPNDSRYKDSPPAHFGAGKQHFAFEVQNSKYELVKNQLVDKGVKIIDEVTWKSGKKSFYFEDISGNVLEVVPENGIWD